MKFLFTSAISALALVAPVLGAELEDRNHRYYGQQQAQAQNANVVTVHDTVVSTQIATQFVTVTVGDQGAQCTQAAADAIQTTTAHSGSSGSSGSGSNNNNNQNHQAATRTAAAHHHLETVTRTKVVTKTVTRETPVTITETTRNSVHVHTVTSTVTEQVRQTQVVTDTITVQETDFVTDHVTQTDDAAAAAQTTTTGDAGIADVNTDVVTVTDVETSTFFFTTTVDGVVATETGTTTITSDAAASTSDVGGNIADVTTTTTNTDTSTTTSTAASSNGTDDPQTSLTLDPRVIESAFAQDGQETPTPGQVKSLTSTNNFINYCLTQNVPLTDGQQIRGGSCNVVPQGFIIAKAKIPSAKFVFPQNFSKIPANQPFTAKLKIKNLQAGAFTNANTNYYAAPAQVNDQGILIGHSHLVIEAINGLDDTEPADPTKFAFFKGLNAPLDGDDTVSAALANGLPAGTYRMFSINTAANHQPALASVAQHGSMDDGIYFTCE